MSSCSFNKALFVRRPWQALCLKLWCQKLKSIWRSVMNQREHSRQLGQKITHHTCTQRWLIEFIWTHFLQELSSWQKSSYAQPQTTTICQIGEQSPSPSANPPPKSCTHVSPTELISFLFFGSFLCFASCKNSCSNSIGKHGSLVSLRSFTRMKDPTKTDPSPWLCLCVWPSLAIVLNENGKSTHVSPTPKRKNKKSFR